MRTLSGNHAAWLMTVARELREAGKPVPLRFLYDVVPSQFATATNDGHVTAAANDLPRTDYRAGQRIWVEEAVAALRKAGLVDGLDDALVWNTTQDGVWRVPFRPGIKPTIYGRAESQASRDKHMLGDGSPGYLLMGWAEAEVEVEVGATDTFRKGRHTLEVHPLAFAIPPMSPEEQQQVRADIEKHGVRMPLTLYPDATDKTARGKPKLKVLDGRHRLQFASALGKPVRVELFEGTEQEARDLVSSLNFARRHLTTAQKARAVERLYGEAARAEAKEAKNGGWKQREYLRASLPEDSDGNSDGDRWEHRAVRMVPGGAGVSPRSVRHMAEVAKAPKTAARVDSGEIRTVSEAVREAAAELNKPTPPDPWQATVRTELSRARGHLSDGLVSLSGSVELTKTDELVGLLDEIDRLSGKIREAFRARGIL